MLNDSLDINNLLNNFRRRLHSLNIDSKSFDTFFQIYELTAWYGSSNEQFLLKDYEHSKCRFCKEDDPDHFNNKAHVIPQMFGRPNLVSNYECDNCNKLFQEIETDLGSFTMPDRVILGHKKKKYKKKSKYFPTYQSNSTRVSHLADNDDRNDIPEELLYRDGNRRSTLLIENNDKSDKTFIMDGNDMILNFEVQSYTPINVFKAFCKIYFGLESMHELNKLELLRKWLIQSNKTDSLNSRSLFTLMETRYLNQINYFEYPVIWILKKRMKELNYKNTEFFSKTMVMFFGNMIYQIFIPFVDEDQRHVSNKKELLGLRFPHFLNPKNLKCTCESNECITEFAKAMLVDSDLSKNGKTKLENRSYTFKETDLF